MDIKITFINKSFDKKNTRVVIFQKNVATNFEETAIAWRVIKNCGYNWRHEFSYPMNFDVAVKDTYGNVSNQLGAKNGQKWVVKRLESGDELILDADKARSQKEVEIKNGFPIGSIDAQIYKSGKLLASKTGISPGEKAVFEFEPFIYVGLNAQIEEGTTLNAAILKDINTKFSLSGINEANLIMTGGGIGPNATPFKFELIKLS